MSDIDEMEVDMMDVDMDDDDSLKESSRKAKDKGIVFSSKELEKEKKRSAANLPIQAGDTLPWVEKYRPEQLHDVAGHEDILKTIDKFISTNKLPHLLFYGPPGTGKTTTILALARKIYGSQGLRQQVLELNASDDRGIDVVREQIKTFASTKKIFSSSTTASSSSSSSNSSLATFKLIILDEADAMTSTAQNALRRIMEKYTSNTRFCIIANYSHKLNPALLSRCTRFRFSPLSSPAIHKRISHVIEKEGVKITQNAIDALVSLSKGDMRRALNVLQACFASSTPLPPPGKVLTEKEMIREEITLDMIYECIAAPLPADVKIILDSLLTEDISTSLRTMEEVRKRKGLALVDVLAEIANDLCQLEVPAEVRIRWLEGLSEVEYRLGSGGHEKIQAGAVVGVVRQGVEYLEKKGKKPFK